MSNKKQVKQNKKSINAKSSNTIRAKGCIYLIDDRCIIRNKNSNCMGYIRCSNYKSISSNKCGLAIDVVKQKITLRVSIHNINNKTFIKNNSHYVLPIKCMMSTGTYIKLELELYSIFSYINFLFDDFENTIRKNNDILSIIIENPPEIVKRLKIPYKKLPDKLSINHMINNPEGNLHIHIRIPKTILFKKLNDVAIKPHIVSQQDTRILSDVKHISDNNKESNITVQSIDHEVGITAIVLNDNRKCTNEHHLIQDIQAELRIATPSNGLVLHKIPAAYCKSCDLYFVFKNDFKEAQALGEILCPVIDKTQKHLDKIAKRKAGGESRIHQLGYNVRKGNECSDEQRQMILANIVENTDISKYEITSLISKCIAQHKTQDNYVNSVNCWQHDLEFISNYKLGDMPEVIVEKIIIGKRT